MALFDFVPLTNVFWILSDVLQVLVILIFAEVLVSWAYMFGVRGASPYSPWVRNLRKVTDPLLNPFRKLVPPYKLRGIDVSPFLAILLIEVVRGFLYKAGAGAG
jgi:YggT family protein